jgi:hypothetical protein
VTAWWNPQAAVGGKLTIGVRDHDYQAFMSYPDGSVAYPAAGTSIRIARCCR